MLTLGSSGLYCDNCGIGGGVGNGPEYARGFAGSAWVDNRRAVDDSSTTSLRSMLI